AAAHCSLASACARTAASFSASRTSGPASNRASTITTGTQRTTTSSTAQQTPPSRTAAHDDQVLTVYVAPRDTHLPYRTQPGDSTPYRAVTCSATRKAKTPHTSIGSYGHPVHHSMDHVCAPSETSR